MNLFCLNKFYDNEEIVVVVLGIFNARLGSLNAPACASEMPDDGDRVCVCECASGWLSGCARVCVRV